MHVKAIAAALLLGLLPATAMAQCSWEHRDQSVSQCPDGQAYDATSGACIKQTTS